MKKTIALNLLCLGLAALLASCGAFSTPVANPGGPWYADPAGNDANDCLSPGTACATIQAAIDKAQPGGTVIAAAGTYDEHLVITKAVILQGAGMNDTMIDANGSDRTVVVGAAQVEIHQLTLRNGSSTGNGGNLVNNGDLTVTDVRIELGSADAGGGIFNNNSLILSGVEVVGNGAEDGAGIYNAGTAMATASQLLIQNNPATQAGGGIFNQGEFVLNDSVIAGNSAEGDGGGFFNGLDGSMDITGTTISDNVTTRGYSGGGFYNRGQLDLVNSNVLNNLADAVGGGGANNGTLLSINTNYEGNTSVDVGGGLYNNGDKEGPLSLDVRGGQFLNNTGRDGGALFNQGPAYLQDATLDSNQAQSGGGIFNSSDTLELVNIVISSNQANNDSGPGGGAIYSVGASEVIITNGLLEGNQALTANGQLRGGAIDARGTELIISGTTIRDNSAAIGGGVAAEHGHFELHSSTVEDNHASLQGGGIWLKEAHGFNVNLPPAIIRRSTLSGNSSDAFGGGLYNDATTLTVDDSTISGNTAATNGGGAFVDRADIYRSTFTGNNADGSGGALLVTFGDVTTLTNVTVSGNSAETGGAASVINGSIFLRYSTVANNQTASGAALRLTARAGATSLARLVGSVLADNNGLNCSGGIFDSFSANVADDFSCKLDQLTDKQNTDPDLGPLQDNGGYTHTHALLLGSPAINSDACHSVNQDQREEPRPADGQCDSGAYERQQELVFVTDGPVCAGGIFADASLRSISLRENQGLLIVIEVPEIEPGTELPGQFGGMDYICRTDPSFDGRLFCIGPELPLGGQATFQLYHPDCTDPVFEEPITVPLRPTPTPTPRVTPTRDPSGGR